MLTTLHPHWKNKENISKHSIFQSLLTFYLFIYLILVIHRLIFYNILYLVQAVKNYFYRSTSKRRKKKRKKLTASFPCMRTLNSLTGFDPRYRDLVSATSPETWSNTVLNKAPFWKENNDNILTYNDIFKDKTLITEN